MIRGALKRTFATELASYLVYVLICVVALLVLAVVPPGITPMIPEWVIFLFMIGVQLWLYKRFYGRL
jgi:hypothetical protein